MQRKTIKKKLVLKKEVKVFLNKLLISTLIFLIGLISVKQKPDLKKIYKEKIYEDSFKFTKVKNFYEKYFGNFLSVDKISKDVTPVFSEKITYISSTDYKDGVALTVSNNYLVPTIESGIVIYIGEKENYGQTIIVEQVNGIDVFYSNIDPIDIKLYDYVEKGKLLGETKDNTLYLLFQKNGERLDYKKYI